MKVKGVSVAVLASVRIGVGLSIASVLVAACGHGHPVLDSTASHPHAGQPTTKPDTPHSSSTPTVSGQEARKAPPCPPVHELSYIVGVHLHATGGWAHVNKGRFRQLCTYAPPKVDVAGEAGGYPDAPFSFRVPAVRGAATVKAAHAHFALLLGQSLGTENALRGATLVREPLFGPGAFLVRLPGHGLASPASCEVVEAYGDGQPIGVRVSAVPGQPRPLRSLCRQALAAAHMVP